MTLVSKEMQLKVPLYHLWVNGNASNVAEEEDFVKCGEGLAVCPRNTQFSWGGGSFEHLRQEKSGIFHVKFSEISNVPNFAGWRRNFKICVGGISSFVGRGSIPPPHSHPTHVGTLQ